MSAAQDYILCVDVKPDEARLIATNTAQNILLGKSGLIEVVQSLKSFISHEDATIRSKAIQYLNAVLESLDKDLLSRHQMKVLTEFFCARMTDSGSIRALEHMQGLPKFTEEMTFMIMRAIPEKFTNLQIYPQSRRFEVYNILYVLMHNHRKALKEMGDFSSNAIINTVANEKDPRNLMVIFSILHVVIVEWDISEFTENIFESVFCYFPITFRPPPNDPYGITADDLKKRLRLCISSSSHFAPFVFPQLIDKLDSPSAKVKKDVLDTVEACALSYGAQTMTKYSNILWESLKFEILTEQSKEMAADALNALKALAISLQGSDTQGNLGSESFIEVVLEEFKESLGQPQQKRAQSMTQILKAVATSSISTYVFVIRRTLPLLTNMYERADDHLQCKGLLTILLQVLESGSGLREPKLLERTDFNCLESSERDQIFTSLTHTLMSTDPQYASFRIVALKCLKSLCLYNRLITEGEASLAIQYFNEFLLISDTDGNRFFAVTAADALRQLSANHSQAVLEKTIPFLLSKLDEIAWHDEDRSIIVLDAMSRIGTCHTISDIVVRRLLTRLESCMSDLENVKYAQSLMLTLDKILKNSNVETCPNTKDYFQKVSTFIYQTGKLSRDSSKFSPSDNVRILSSLGSLTCTIIKRLSYEDQHTISFEIYNLFTPEPVSVDFESRLANYNAADLSIILSSSLMAGMAKSISLPYNDDQLTLLANHIVSLAISEENGPVRHFLHQHICLLFNKFLSVEILAQVKIVKWLVRRRTDSGYSPDRRSVQTLFWVAKALVTRLFHVDDILQSLLDLLRDNEYGTSAAQGFTMLLAKDRVTNKENGANVRLIYAQKVLSASVSRLVDTFRRTDIEGKTNVLIALSGLIANMQSSVLFLDIDSVIPLLLQSLDLGNIDVGIATLKTVLAILQEAPEKLSAYLPSLVSRFEALFLINDLKSSERRFLCLQCLQSFPLVFSRRELMECDENVQKIVSLAIDDAKRHVRKKGVDCRQAWIDSNFLVDEDD